MACPQRAGDPYPIRFHEAALRMGQCPVCECCQNLTLRERQYRSQRDEVEGRVTGPILDERSSPARMQVSGSKAPSYVPRLSCGLRQHDVSACRQRCCGGGKLQKTSANQRHGFPPGLWAGGLSLTRLLEPPTP